MRIESILNAQGVSRGQQCRVSDNGNIFMQVVDSPYVTSAPEGNINIICGFSSESKGPPY